MEPASFSKIKIQTLRRYLQERRFAIPKLQRNFVWDPRRSAKLLDSIYRQMPIGSFFLWELPQQSAHLIRQSTGVLPAFSTGNGHIWFVIDGQQRLSVIHQAFEGEERENDAGKKIKFGHLCFSVNSHRRKEESPLFVYRQPIEREYVPVKGILAPDWKNNFRKYPKSIVSKIQKCRSRLLSYVVPYVLVRTKNMDEIGEVFIRINSQGMRITSADRAIAIMGTIDVRAMAQELRQRIHEKVFAIKDVATILLAFNLIDEPMDAKGTPPKLDAMAKRLSKRLKDKPNEIKKFKKTWKKFQNAFCDAVDYLHHRFPVYNESFLPSANMLATLTAFFYYQTGQPNKHQSLQIRKWFWATAVGQRYSGRGYHRNILSDAKFFKSIAQGSQRSFVFHERLDPVLDIQATEYSSSSSRSRAFFCLLAKQKPCYLDNGGAIPIREIASVANRNERHHIFPRTA